MAKYYYVTRSGRIIEVGRITEKYVWIPVSTKYSRFSRIDIDSKAVFTDLSKAAKYAKRVAKEEIVYLRGLIREYGRKISHIETQQAKLGRGKYKPETHLNFE